MRHCAQTRRAVTRRWVVATVCTLPLALHARVSSAQGFGLNEVGSCAIARGFAATGSPCADVSTVYWNPAATTSLPGLSVYGGVSAIAVRGAFTADTTGRVDKGDVPTEYPPFLGINWTPASHRYALGVAAYVPYGLTSQWGTDFVGRFSAQKAALQSVYVQPNVAVELVPGKFSVGGGPTIGWSQLELRQSLDIASQQAQPGVTFAQLGIAPGTEFARAQVKGSATGVGFNVGAHWQPTPALSLGARYLSKVRFKYDGADATFTQ
jgi:long-chain fatty acid transport protein